ncbi:MAG: porin [Opitutaceae bacterium]
MSTTRILLRLSAAGLLATAGAAHADEASLRKEIEELRKLVKELQTEVQATKAEVKSAKQEVAAATSANAEGLKKLSSTPATADDLESLKDLLEEKLDRRLATKSRVNLAGSGIAGYYDNRGSQSTFRIAQAALTFAGNLREDPVKEGDVKYKIGFSYAAAPSASGSSSVNATDVTVAWDLKRGKGDLEPDFTYGLTFGQQYVPFGSDNNATEDKQPTINKAQYVSRYNLGRDIGLILDGGWKFRNDAASGSTIPVLQYYVGIFNGAVRPSGAPTATWGPTIAKGSSSFSGTTANRWDNNDSKDYFAKVLWTPTERYYSFFQGLKIGGSYYYGQDTAWNLERDRKGIELEWLKKPFLITAEYVRGSDEYVTAATGTGALRRKVKSDGLVATLFYRPNTLANFEPLIRYDRFDSDNAVAKTVYTVGFNWYFWQTEPIVRRTYNTMPTERVLKLQVNYNCVVEEGPNYDDDQFLSQIVFSF